MKIKERKAKNKYKKFFLTRYFNHRIIRHRSSQIFFGIFPALQKSFYYFPHEQPARETSNDILFDSLECKPVSEFGIPFTNQIREYIHMRRGKYPDQLTTSFTVSSHTDVLFLGHTGTVIDIASSSIILKAGAVYNYRWPRRLRYIQGDPEKIYIPLMGVHKGHKQYYHFFEQFFQPLYLYIRDVYDAAKPIVIVTRKDLSLVQQETYTALLKMHPSIEWLQIDMDEALYCMQAHLPLYKTIGKDGFFIQPDYIQFLNGLLSSHFNLPSPNPSKRIYISRRDAKLRHILNEPELLPILEKYGFEIIATGHMPLIEQIQLYQNASHIVTTHGAGLTNLLFASPGTKVLEIASADFGSCDFLWISAARQLEHSLMVCGKEYAYQHFYCDPKMLEEHILKMINSPSKEDNTSSIKSVELNFCSAS